MSDLNELLDLIGEHGKKVIIKDGSVLGVCDCAGEGAPEVWGIFGENFRSVSRVGSCDGKGTCRIWEGQDPCGASLYDYIKCPNMKTPKRFVDGGAGI